MPRFKPAIFRSLRSIRTRVAGLALGLPAILACDSSTHPSQAASSNTAPAVQPELAAATSTLSATTTAAKQVATTEPPAAQVTLSGTAASSADDDAPQQPPALFAPILPPTCKYIGTRSEGWYDTKGQRLAYGKCAGKTPQCQHQGTRSEGWYTDDERIAYALCHTPKAQSKR